MVKFVDIKDQLIEKFVKGLFPSGVEESVILIEGIFNIPINTEAYDAAYIPMIAVVGKKSGRIYYYALKMLLPDLKI